MNHIKSLQLLSIAFIFNLALLGCQQKVEPTVTNPTKPNVVLIVVDDIGYADMSFTGSSNDVQTPAIDALAKSGTYFSNAYATSSICSPSRAGLITGSYQHKWGTFWYGGDGIKDPSYKTIPELLKQQNYATGYVGKVHYGSNDHFVSDRSFPLNHGFDYFYGHTSARKHYLNHVDKKETEFQSVKTLHNKSGQSLRQQAMWENTSKHDTVGFSTEIIGQKARDFIGKHKNEPFFLQVSFNAVHNFTHQLPQEYLDANGLKGYHDWDPSKEEYYEWYKQGRYPNNPEGRAQYLGQLQFLDKEIGNITRFLKQQGLAENTIVIFISDNGGSTPIYANNSPLKGSKYTMYEGGIRVPLIISYPSTYTSGTTSNNLVSGMDVLPTLCKAIGINSPTNIDGIDLSDLLTGSDNSIQHEYLVWDNKAQNAVRKGKWKFRTANEGAKANSDYEMVEMEYGEFLYDIEKDAGETTNIASEHPEIFAELKNIHANWRKEIDEANKKFDK